MKRWPKSCHNLLLALCLFLPITALASDNATGPANAGPVKLVSGPHYPPFSADYLPHNGLGPFLVKRVFEDSGATVTLGFRPWKRGYREILQGKYDAILPYITTPNRRKDFFFSVPVFNVNVYIYVRADSGINAQSLKELKGRAYCSPLGFADGEALEQMHTEGDLVRVSAPTLKNCFQMLVAGRVDFIKTNHFVSEYMGTHHDFSAEDIHALPFIVERASLHVMVPKTHPDGDTLISTFDRSYSKMTQSGRIMELTEEYLERIDVGGGPSLIEKPEQKRR